MGAENQTAAANFKWSDQFWVDVYNKSASKLDALVNAGKDGKKGKKKDKKKSKKADKKKKKDSDSEDDSDDEFDGMITI